MTTSGGGMLENEGPKGKTYNIFEYYDTRAKIQIVLLLVAFCAGIPTNLLSLAISMKRQRYVYKRFHVLQINRSLADLLLLCVYIPSQLFHEINTGKPWDHGDLACKLFKFSRNFAYQASSNVIVAIAIDRWKGLNAVVHGGTWTMSHLKKTILTAWFLAAFLSAPHFGVAQVVTYVYKDTTLCFCDYVWRAENITMISLGETSHEEKSFIVMKVLVQFWLPVVALATIYRKIWLLLRRRTDSVSDKPFRRISSKKDFILRVFRRNRNHQRTAPAASYAQETDDDDFPTRSEDEEVANGGAEERPPSELDTLVAVPKDSNGSPLPTIPEYHSPVAMPVVSPSPNPSSDRTQWRGLKAANTAMRRSMLITVTYIILWLPYNSLFLWQLADKESYVQHLDAGVLYVMQVMSSVINPWMYSLCGPK